MNIMMNTIIVTVIMLGLVTNPVLIKASTFYYEFDQEGREQFVDEEIEFRDNNNTEENIQYILQCLFDNTNDRWSFIPKDVILTHILYINGSLEIEVSDDILDYGGTAREIAMVDQILATVFSFEEIDSFTLLVKGERKFLVEGTIINGYTRDNWKERMDLIE